MFATQSPLRRQPVGQQATGAARRLIVVTDIDASLLEPGLRSVSDERAALDFLAARGVPLVINSSRTRAEIEGLHQTLHMRTPFISEHGSALFIPHRSCPLVPAGARPAVGGDVLELGLPYHEVVETLQRTSRELDIDIVGFSELTIDEVAHELSVPIGEARLAKLREYTELFRIVDERPATRSRLSRALRRRGLRCWPLGGRYLVTATRSRAESLKALKAMWTAAWGEPVIVGIGDSEDDVPWLQLADVAVFVQDDRAGLPSRVLSKLPTVHITRSPGRGGWSQAIVEFVGALLDERQPSGRTDDLRFPALSDVRPL